MGKYVIFDLDGVLSDDGWRRGLLPHGFGPNIVPELFDPYHAAAERDLPTRAFGWFVDRHIEDHWVICTARPAKWRDLTSRWLATHLQPAGINTFAVFHRNNGDVRKSVDVKRQQLKWLLSGEYGDITISNITHAYDDKEDVARMYAEAGINSVHVTPQMIGALADELDDRQNDELIREFTTATRQKAKEPRGPAQLLREGAALFEERNAAYGDSYLMVGAVLTALFPNGVTLRSQSDFTLFHNFMLKVVKLSRYAGSGLTHTDSIRDDAVYSAICESLTTNQRIGEKS